jgi:modification methylase
MASLTTTHRVIQGDARDLSAIPSASVDLVVTSPPYPMVSMWDGVFAELSSAVADAWRRGQWAEAFEAMHRELDRAWSECHRVLRPGGFACVNVGDATRTFDDDFRLFSNHARVIGAMERTGFTTLPDILWRKPTNAPNKFMGSGMLPAGAYVTYEHEYILIFRKGPRRAFASGDAAERRRASAFFWEERNVWFSDVWTDLTGVKQRVDDTQARDRSAAFPFELAYRLVQMFSVAGDLVLDPFAGVGTTQVAALASARNSVGLERDAELIPVIERALLCAPELGRARNAARLAAHAAFIDGRERGGKPPRHRNESYGFPVVTGQETTLVLRDPVVARVAGPGLVEAEHCVPSSPSAR